MNTDDKMRESFQVELEKLQNSKNMNSVLLSREKYCKIIDELNNFKNSTSKKPTRYYNLKKRFDVFYVEGVAKLISPITYDEDNQPKIIYHVHTEELFDILKKSHTATGHGGRNRMEFELKRKFNSITREVIQIFLGLCEACHKKNSGQRKGIVTNPLITKRFMMRMQIDLIDMQTNSDGEYSFIMVCQDHMTKFCILRALKDKSAQSVATEVRNIFCLFGAPQILHTDNGREFKNNLLKSTIAELWPYCKMIHGKPRHSQSQGSVERANQDVKNMLAAHCADKGTTHWASELDEIQYKKNTSLHEGIRCTPYVATFACDPEVNAISSCDDQLIETSELDELCESSQSTEPVLSEQIDPEIETEKINAFNLFLEMDKSNKEFVDSSHMSSSAPTTKPTTIEHVNQLPPEIDTRLKRIHQKRKLVSEGIETQAKKMLKTSNLRFQPAKVGDTVKIPIPNVDKGPLDQKHLLARVMEVDSAKSLYTLGTPNGTLSQKYSRGEFAVLKQKFLVEENIDPQLKALRTIASEQSLHGGQGFVKCDCKKLCNSSRCKCKSMNLLCNSRCHNSSSCHNKHV